MKDLIGTVVVNNSCCPDCTLKTRIIGFVITFILGFILLILSFGALGGVFLGQVGWFAILYSLGNITALCSYIKII